MAGGACAVPVPDRFSFHGWALDEGALSLLGDLEVVPVPGLVLVLMLLLLLLLQALLLVSLLLLVLLLLLGVLRDVCVSLGPEAG